MMVKTPTEFSGSKPYKGPESYQVEDSHLFFGRDREGEQLIARILSSRFTLVHAQSGAGKTSLLNAHVIPQLEARGWGTFRILPQNDPVMSLRETTLSYVMPPPKAEMWAIERAARALAPSGEDLTIEELLNVYDRLHLRDVRRGSLVGTVADPASIDCDDAEMIGPLFNRLLCSHIEVETFSEHFSVIWKHGADRDEKPPKITSATRLSELLNLLADDRVASGYQRLYDELNVPVPDICVFFENLFEVYGSHRTRFALVLILDQFEELFTRFVDPGPASMSDGKDLPDWRLRKEFFDQFARLYGRAGDMDEASGEDHVPAVNDRTSRLPLRYVISMRDEYIAQLDPIRPFVGTLDDVSFHLNLLGKEQSEAAIREPAKQFGYNYSDECFAEIIKQLTKEDRFIEPAHLQLVCEKLWNEQGVQLAALSPGDPLSINEPQIPISTFESLGGTSGILNSFFKDFLDGLELKEKREALELLEALVTVSGTRNIVERDQLVNALFRNGLRRADILKRMTDRTIVRTERRLGGYFVEITHEFLIAPVLEAIRDTFANEIEYSRFRVALRTLELLNTVGIGSGMARLLTVQEFVTLRENWQEVEWNRWAIEVMIRSAITNAVDREDLRHCFEAYDSLDQSVDVTVLIDPESQDLLSLADLRLVNDSRDGLALTLGQLAKILRSTVASADDEERDQIRYWTQRMDRHAS